MITEKSNTTNSETDGAKSVSSINLLSSRWTEEQIENALSISNDISEDIDNKESRKELRQAIAIYADLLSDESIARKTERSEISIWLLKKFTELNSQFGIENDSITHK